MRMILHKRKLSLSERIWHFLAVIATFLVPVVWTVEEDGTGHYRPYMYFDVWLNEISWNFTNAVRGYYLYYEFEEIIYGR